MSFGPPQEVKKISSNTQRVCLNPQERINLSNFALLLRLYNKQLARWRARTSNSE